MSLPEQAPRCLPPRPLRPARGAVMPPGTWDTHCHVIPPEAPLSSPRSYTPCPAPLARWIDMADTLGIARGVAVQPSVFGTDNSALLTALAEARGRLLGIAVIPADTPDSELRRLHDFGVRGIRVNIRNLGGLSLSDVPDLAKRIAPLGWHLEFQVGPAQFDALGDMLDAITLPAVIDHAGFVPVGPAEVEGSTVALQRLLDRPACWLKLSAPYRLEEPPYQGMATLATRLADSHGDRLLWASDWPHTELFEQVPDDIELAETMLGWLGADQAHRICALNPARLYGCTEQE